MRALALAVVVVAACTIKPEYSGTLFLCPDLRCPSGFDCIEGVCYEGGVLPFDAAPDADPPDAALPLCPTDCSEVLGTDICFCADEIDYAASVAACAAEGFRLAKIDTQAVADIIRQDALDRGDLRMWIGATDLAVEGDWRWDVDGELFWQGLADGAPPAGAFADFNTGEPNQFMDREEDCLEAWSTGWNDGVCASPRPYYCQRP